MSTARDQILEVTCELLEVQGYHATGLNQIIKESGSPKGSLYYYFPGGKEELTEEAIIRVGKIVEERIINGLSISDHPAEAVRGFINQIAYHVEAADYRAGGPITTVALETASNSDRLRQTCDTIYAAWQRAFITKLTKGGVKPDRASQLASLIISALEGGIILARTSRSPRPLQHVAEELGLLIEATT